MIKKILVASLTTAMILGISLTAFADEEDLNTQGVSAQGISAEDVSIGGYNEYGLSYAAIDALTSSANEGISKYPVNEVITNDGYTTVIYQNGFTMDYYDDWTNLFADTDDGGKNLFVYFDITLPSVDAIAALLAEKGYTVLYSDIESTELPVYTCAVNTDAQSVMINAGFNEPVYWDINSDGQGQMNISYSFNDAIESAD